MKPIRTVLLAASLLLLLAGCASTQVTARESNLGNEKLPKPDRILVYDFAASPADIPPGSAMAGRLPAPDPPPTAEHVEAGRALGAAVAKELASEIREMGLPAQQVGLDAARRVGDLVFMGYFLSVDEGSAARRMLVGFGSGSAELKTHVEAYTVTDRGLRQLGSGDLDSGGSKMPGTILPLAVTLATANPIGLIVGGTVKVAGEVTGSQKIEGAGKRTAREIAKVLRPRFEQQGWID